MRTNGLTSWLGRPVPFLREQWGVPALEIHDRTTSTNDRARELAETGAPQGTTVIAEEQSLGRGRQGRSWTAPPASSLLLSMVLWPETPDAGAILPLRLGLAAARAIEQTVDLQVGLKWPNDLLARGRKIAGILCEGAVEPGGPFHVIAGIGINVHQCEADWPPELRGDAASLEQLTQASLDRATLAHRLVHEWLLAGAAPQPRLDPDELRELERRDVLRGRDLFIDGQPAGIGQGFEPDGALRVGPAGNPRPVRSGTVRLHPGHHEPRP
jgi:BirA family transcriptional regulator, biotin operon repressor / biotin---[acetyl-CoA-carboxylase] ligase